MNSNKKIINILLISVIFIGMYFLMTFAFGDVKFEYYIGLLGLVSIVVNRILINRGVIAPPAHLAREFVADPLTQLTFTDSTLIFGKYEIHKSKIKKVVLDSVQAIDSAQHQGLVQLPFNQQKGQIPELWFDPLHLQRLREYFSEQVPDVTFVK